MNIGQADLWWHSLSAADRNLFLLNLQSFVENPQLAAREVSIFSSSLLHQLDSLDNEGEPNLVYCAACAIADGIHASLSNFTLKNFSESEAEVLAIFNITLLAADGVVDYADSAFSAKLITLSFSVNWTTYLKEFGALKLLDNSCLLLEFKIPLKLVNFSNYELSRPMEIKKC